MGFNSYHIKATEPYLYLVSWLSFFFLIMDHIRANNIWQNLNVKFIFRLFWFGKCKRSGIPWQIVIKCLCDSICLILPQFVFSKCHRDRNFAELKTVQTASTIRAKVQYNRSIRNDQASFVIICDTELHKLWDQNKASTIKLLIPTFP